MDSEQRRRVIGNTRALLIFNEAKEPLDVSLIEKLGRLAQIIIVVQKYDNNYWRLACLNRFDIPPFIPELPSNYLFDDKSLRNFILVKSIF